MKKSFMKIVSLTIIVILLIPFNHIYQAYSSKDKSELEEFNERVQETKIKDIIEFFENQIILANDELKSRDTEIEKASVKERIKGYSSMLKNINDNKITDSELDKGKKFLNEEIIKSQNYLNITENNKSESQNHDKESRRVAEPGELMIVTAALYSTIKVGDEMGYTVSSRLLAQSMTAKPGSTYDIWNNDSITDSRIKASSYYKNKLPQLKALYKNSGQATGFKRTFTDLVFAGGNSTIEKDMYYAIRNLNPGGEIQVDNGYAHIILKDKYDFDAVIFPTSMAEILGNLGQVAVDIELCSEYYIRMNTIEPFYDSIPPGVAGYPGYAVAMGSTGATVTKIQQRLNNLGFNMIPDGSFGPTTDTAVRSFQRSRRISVDGSVGPTTWDWLFNKNFRPSYPGYACVYGITGADVLLIQARLNQLGYTVGFPDGSFGPKTQSEVKRFQGNKGLAVDGSVGPATWSTLFG